VAYRFIDEYKNHFGLRWLLRRLNLYPNGYYNYLRNRKAEYQKKKETILNEIKRIYHDTGGILGHRAMRIFLQRKGINLSKTTVHKYMNKVLGIACICRMKRAGYQKGKPHKVFPNLLEQNFQVSEKNKVWCSDFTYLKLTNGKFRYNCTIIDLHERCAVATVTGRWITTELAEQALEKALQSQGISGKGLIFHTDQGSQYTSIRFIDICNSRGIIQSMSKAGCPYDNAPMERFYSTMKEELIYRFHFHTDDELNHAVSEYVYGWYNQIRPHSYNDYLTPMEARLKS